MKYVDIFPSPQKLSTTEVGKLYKGPDSLLILYRKISVWVLDRSKGVTTLRQSHLGREQATLPLPQRTEVNCCPTHTDWTFRFGVLSNNPSVTLLPSVFPTEI